MCEEETTKRYVKAIPHTVHQHFDYQFNTSTSSGYMVHRNTYYGCQNNFDTSTSCLFFFFKSNLAQLFTCIFAKCELKIIYFLLQSNTMREMLKWLMCFQYQQELRLIGIFFSSM